MFRDNVHSLPLSYADLESIGSPPGIGPSRAMLLRFGGEVPRAVRIEGRLLDAARHLRQRRIAWIWETTPGGNSHLGDAVPIVTRINVWPTG